MEGQPWRLKYGFDSDSPNRAETPLPPKEGERDAGWVFEIPIVQNSKPGIRAKLILRCRQWR